MITLIALSRLIAMKGNYRIRKKHGRDISRGDGACLSFPVETSEPELESRAMKKKQTETKSRCGFGLTRHLIGGVMCLAVISLICSRASAQNLFAVDLNNGNIDEFTANGVRSTIAFGLNYPAGLAFDQAGNLFVADGSAIDKFTPAGVRTTFASGLSPRGLTFDSAGNLFVADAGSSAVYKFTPAGVRTTFASGLSLPHDLAFDRAGNLFVSAGDGVSNPGTVYKFTPAGVRTTFASGLFYPFALAFDSRGNLFVADGGFAYDLIFGAAVYKFTSLGLRSTVASENDQVRVIPVGLAIDSADNLFVADGVSGSILKFAPSGMRTTFTSGFVTDSGCCVIIAPMAFQPRAMAFQSNVAATDFNNDGKPDYLLYNPSTGHTAIWYLNNNVHIGVAAGPTAWAGWSVVGVADFNLDGHPDYLLVNPNTGHTAIWYLNNNVRVGHAFGPTPWPGWNVAGVADFNLDGHPDYLLLNPNTGHTAIWYLNNNVRVGHAFGPTVWAGWSVVGVADFNRDGHPDYLLLNPNTGHTAIWYLNEK